MHSARTALATAAATAVLALGAPGAHAAGDDWDHTDSSYSKEHDKEQDKEQDKDGGHDSPRGGMHTGGGALTAVNKDDWGTARDSETYKDSGQGKDSWGGGHEKPSGGLHTGGGALASPAVTTSGLAVLAVAATGLYAARRKRTARSMA